MERNGAQKVKKSFKDNVISVYLAVSTLFGTKKKVDKLNEESIEKAKKDNELTILLHGYLANYYRSMYSTIGWLKKRGINVYSIGYNYKEPTRKAATDVRNLINKAMKDAGVSKINLIGISLGGVIARYYAEKLDGKKHIDKLVTVYTPLKPVPEKDLAFRFHEFLGNNPDLANKGIEEIRGRYSVKNYLAIYGLSDKIIRLECATSRKVKQIAVAGGHIFVSYNPKVLEVAAKYVREGKVLEEKL